MASQLERAINLAKITGDKIIVVDEKEKNSVVIMSIDEYEKLLKKEKKDNISKSLTEDELLDKINCDISCYKDGSFNNSIFSKNINHEDVDEEELEEDFEEDEAEDENEEEVDEDMYYYGEDDEDDEIKNEEDLKSFSFPEKSEIIKNEDEDNENKNKGWKIPSEVIKGAEEIKE